MEISLRGVNSPPQLRLRRLCRLLSHVANAEIKELMGQGVSKN